MKRKYFNRKTISLAIKQLRQSQQFKDRYFITTDETGTSLHDYLIQNDGKGKFAGSGSFIINESYLQARAEDLGIPLQSYVNFINSDSNNTIEFDIEERIVGEKLHNDDGTITLDRNGDEIVYNGDNRTTETGESYFLVQNHEIVLSNAVKARLLDIDSEVIVAYRVKQAQESMRPKLTAPVRTARRIVDAPEGNGKSDPMTGFVAPVKKRNQSQADYDEQVSLAKDAWLAEHAIA